MLDMMRRTINRNLLKYSAGHAIFCPKCDTVADYHRWVIIERIDGTIAGQCCADCFDAAQGDNPLPEGYTVIREEKPATKVRAPARGAVPQKPGKALNTFLRRDIFASHKRNGNCNNADREFPKGYGAAPWPMLDRLTVDADDNGTVHIDYAGDPVFTKLQIDTYIEQFCRLNHLRGA